MSQHPDSLNTSAKITLFGDVMASDFPNWILRHAAKLGLRSTVTPMEGCLIVQADGPDVLLEALSLACSLGPASVLVDRVEFTLSEVE